MIGSKPWSTGGGKDVRSTHTLTLTNTAEATAEDHAAPIVRVSMDMTNGAEAVARADTTLEWVVARLG